MLTFLLAGLAGAAAGFEFSGAECEKSKHCFLDPRGCDPMRNCKIAASWRRKASNSVEIELAAEGSGHYAALGFSRDARMGKDYVVFCTELQGPRPRAYLAVNPNGQQASLTLTPNEVREFATLLHSESKNGRLLCHISLNTNIPSSYRKYVDFARSDSIAQPLRLFLASGAVNDAGAIAYHNLAKAVRPGTANVADGSGLRQPPPTSDDRSDEKAEQHDHDHDHAHHGHGRHDGHDHASHGSHEDHDSHSHEHGSGSRLGAGLLAVLLPLCLARLL